MPVDSEESELLEHLVLSCLSVRLCIVTKFPEQHSFRIHMTTPVIVSSAIGGREDLECVPAHYREG